jgi:hypothetical protein
MATIFQARLTALATPGCRKIARARTLLVIIGRRGLALIVEKVGGIERRGNCLECGRRTEKLETIGKVISPGVGVTE